MKTQKQLLQDFINCMTNSSGAAWQLIHQHQDIRFVPIRDALEGMKNTCMQIAMGPSDEVRAKLPKSNLIILP